MKRTFVIFALLLGCQLLAHAQSPKPQKVAAVSLSPKDGERLVEFLRAREALGEQEAARIAALNRNDEWLQEVCGDGARLAQATNEELANVARARGFLLKQLAETAAKVEQLNTDLNKWLAGVRERLNCRPCTLAVSFDGAWQLVPLIGVLVEQNGGKVR